MQFSSNGGSTYDSAGYAYANVIDGDNFGGPSGTNSGSASAIIMTRAAVGDDVSNVAAEGGLDGEVIIFAPATGSRWTRSRHDLAYMTSDTDLIRSTGAGQRETAQDTDAIRFLHDSGNIASGNYAVYGLR
jgi:hypothetical protein